MRAGIADGDLQPVPPLVAPAEAFPHKQHAVTAVLLLLATAATAACQGTAPSAQPSPAAAAGEPARAAGASIRKTDFRNFRYASGEASWTLVNGTQPDAEEEEPRFGQQLEQKHGVDDDSHAGYRWVEV